MGAATEQQKIYLTGADCFILALELHNKHAGITGNTCRYVLEAAGRLDAKQIEDHINSQTALQELSSFKLGRSMIFGLPYWKPGAGKRILVEEWNSDAFIPDGILERNLSHEGAQLFTFDIVHRSEHKSVLIFSWNHLILDSQGAALLLGKVVTGSPIGSLKTDEKRDKWTIGGMIKGYKVTRFVKRSARKPLTGDYSSTGTNYVKQQIACLSFNEAETKTIDLNVLSSGSKFGPSAYLLTCCAQEMKQLMLQKQMDVSNFWVPVPSNRRKKGAKGPLLGNHLTFLFYRLAGEKIASTSACVADINDQMIRQMRKKMPDYYEALLKIVKRVPLVLYYSRIKKPQGKSISSFLFTLADDHPAELEQIQGIEVENAWSFPPNIYPPGITFAFMRFKGLLRVMILSYHEVLNAGEMELFKNGLRQRLLAGKQN